MDGGARVRTGSYEQARYSELTVSIAPRVGYDFLGWFVDGILRYTAYAWTFSVTESKDVVAMFMPEPLPVATNTPSADQIGLGYFDIDGSRSLVLPLLLEIKEDVCEECEEPIDDCICIYEPDPDKDEYEYPGDPKKEEEDEDKFDEEETDNDKDDDYDPNTENVYDNDYDPEPEYMYVYNYGPDSNNGYGPDYDNADEYYYPAHREDPN